VTSRRSFLLLTVLALLAALITVVVVVGGDRRPAEAAGQCTPAGARMAAVEEAARDWPGAVGLHVVRPLRFPAHPTVVSTIVDDSSGYDGLLVSLRCRAGVWTVTEVQR
jgi:hypothetical protein